MNAPQVIRVTGYYRDANDPVSLSLDMILGLAYALLLTLNLELTFELSFSTDLSVDIIIYRVPNIEEPGG